jgi:hypothetical protein
LSSGGKRGRKRAAEDDLSSSSSSDDDSSSSSSDEEGSPQGARTGPPAKAFRQFYMQRHLKCRRLSLGGVDPEG